MPVFSGFLLFPSQYNVLRKHATGLHGCSLSQYIVLRKYTTGAHTCLVSQYMYCETTHLARLRSPGANPQTCFSITWCRNARKRCFHMFSEGKGASTPETNQNLPQQSQRLTDTAGVDKYPVSQYKYWETTQLASDLASIPPLNVMGI